MTVTIYDGDRVVARVALDQDGVVVATPPEFADHLRTLRVAGSRGGRARPEDGEDYLRAVADLYNRSSYMHADISG